MSVADLNRYVGTGRLTSDPDLKKTIKGDKETVVCKFNMAVNPVFSKQTSFFQVVCFGKQAEFVAKYLQKGRRILVEGQPQQNRYKDKNGKNASVVEIIAQSIFFLDGKKGENDIADEAAYISACVDTTGLETADFQSESLQ